MDYTYLKTFDIGTKVHTGFKQQKKVKTYIPLLADLIDSVQKVTEKFEGLAQVKTTSVGQLKHYAQDAGKTQEDIEKITEPEKAITFVANGVIVK